MTRLINGKQIIPELSVSDWQRISDTVGREWEEKQARLQRQREENRKRLFPKLYTAEQASKKS